MNSRPHIKRLLRSPGVILGEIAGLAIFGAIGAAREEWHVFSSPWFVALTAATAASLSIVVTEQFRRLHSQWRQTPVVSTFHSAPFKIEIERPATTTVPRQKVWTERRLGLAGSLVFHLGLLCLIVAGAMRALFATDATVDLIEGETLAPTAAAWSAQWPGLLARPFRLDQPMVFESIKGSSYAGGDLRELHAKLSAGNIGVNQQLHLNGSKIYLAQEFGPAALLEWNGSEHIAALLSVQGHGNFVGEAAGPAGLTAFLRSDSTRPARVEVRVMRGGALLLAGQLAVGETIALSGGATLALRGTPMWGRLHGSRDSALWLAYCGMILAMAGAAMIFTLIKLDYCLVITPLGATERVFIALKPQRFAPLFQERFEKLVREQSARNEDEKWKMEVGHRAANPSSILHPLSSSPARTACWLLLGTCLALTAGCDRVSPTQARQLVERYNQVVAEAYRRGDVRVIDSVVGPNEGKKLTGLIGVRLDMGLTLDSKLQSLEITSVEHAQNSLRVCTKERWSYRDLKIGTGAQVGQASQDAYEMTYFFTNVNKAWLVDEIKFAAPPQVGRTNMPWVADRAILHGTTKPEAKP
ncbi:MAG: cytochrome c biogenesis protein ResB [Verrucomicrobiota bacterium]